jgi:hypothetical protein
MTSLISRAIFTATILSFVSMSSSFAFAQVTRTANFSRGDRVIVVTTVNVRATPNGAIVGKQSAGATGTLIGGPINANGYTWWNIDYTTGINGWTAEDFMQQASVSVSSNTLTTLTSSSLGQKIAALKAQLGALLAQIKTLQLSQTAGAAASMH